MAKNLNHKCLKLVKEVVGVPNFRDADVVLGCLCAVVCGKEETTAVLLLTSDPFVLYFHTVNIFLWHVKYFSFFCM